MRFSFQLRYLLVCACLLTQRSAASAQALQRQSWTTEDGLPQNSVHALLQATNGRLWLATEGGAARFDGARFERFTTENTPAFASNDLCCVVQATDGAIYFGSSDGIVSLRNGHFERVTSVSGAVEAMQSAPAGLVFALTADGLVEIHGRNEAVATLPGHSQVTALGADETGMPFAAADATLFRWTGMEWRKERSLPVSPLALVQDREDLWLRTRSEIVAITPHGEVRWQIGKELPGTRLESLVRGPDGVIAATSQGTFSLRTTGHGSAPLSNLADESVLSALVDREGDRWFGTDTGGLTVLRQRAVHSVPELARETITCVIEATDGTLWLGTRDGGLRTIQQGVVAVPKVSAKLASQVVLSLAPDARGGVWVGTPEGLDHIAGNAVEHMSAANGLPDDFVRSLLAMQDGSVWVGTRRGLAQWKTDRVERVLTRAEGLPSEVVGSMLRSRNGDLWIGTLKGLARLPAFASKAQPEPGTANQAITGLAEGADGSLWVSSRNGGLLAKLQGQFSQLHLPGVTFPIQAVLPDADGRLWLRTGAGLAWANMADLEACALQQSCSVFLRQYGTADGVSSVDASLDGHPAVWRTRSDMLWFASRRGVSSVDAARLPVDRVPPSVAVEQVLVNGQSVPFESGLRLSAASRRLQVIYAGVSLLAPAQVRYRFRLDGFDRDWTDADTRRVAEYTNLPAGSYRLLVEARNADGVLSESPASLSIRVEPRFYRTWWFYLLALFLITGVVYGIYWLRLRRVRRDFAAVLGERNRIAREIHDTLAQDFVAVSLQLDVTAQLLKKEKIGPARQQVDATRQLVQEGIRDARESIWALRAGNEAQTLPARVQGVVDAAKRAGATAECSVTGSYRALPSSVEQETLRIAKEAFGNAMKHARAGNVRIDLIYSEEAVLLQVSDDGHGFDVEQGTALEGHYGLRGMQERAQAMRGSLDVQSAPGNGTTVRLKLPAS